MALVASGLPLKVSISIREQFNLQLAFVHYQNYQRCSINLFSIILIMLPSFVLFLLFSLTLSIPADHSVPQLQAGTFTLSTGNGSQSQLFMWQHNTSFTLTPQLAFGVSGFSAESLAIAGSFALLPQAVTKTGIIMAWKRQINKWNSVTINYLVSTRTELIMGYRQINLGNESSTDFQVQLGGTVGNISTVVARLYLTGCDAAGTFGCGVAGKGLTQDTMTVTAYVPTGLNNSNLSFSYIIFNPPSAPFSSYGGMLDEVSFSGQFSANIHKTIYHTDYLLFGFSILAFNLSSTQSLSSSIDSHMILSIASSGVISKFRFIYIALGLTSRSVCNTVVYPFQWQSECVSQCPKDTYMYKYPDGGMACNTCSDKLNEVLGINGCICKTQYQMVNGTCVKIIKKVEVDNGTASGSELNSAGLQNLLQLFQQIKNKMKINDNSNISNTYLNTNTTSTIDRTISDAVNAITASTTSISSNISSTIPTVTIQTGALNLTSSKSSQGQSRQSKQSISSTTSSKSSQSSTSSRYTGSNSTLASDNPSNLTSSTSISTSKVNMQAASVVLPSITELDANTITTQSKLSENASGNKENISVTKAVPINQQSPIYNTNTPIYQPITVTSESNAQADTQTVTSQQINYKPRPAHVCSTTSNTPNSIQTQQSVSISARCQDPSGTPTTSAPPSTTPKPCPPNSYSLSGVCFCMPGFTNISGNCLQAQICLSLQPIFLSSDIVQNCQDRGHSCSDNGQSQYRQQDEYDNSCEGSKCKEHFKNESCSDSSIRPNVCSPGYLNASGLCSCPIGYIPFNSSCIKCTSPATFDFSLGTCTYFCGQFAFFNQTTSKCQCQIGYGISSNGRCSYCSDGSFLHSGYCVSCADGKTYNPTTGSCNCPDDYVQDQRGTCVNRCGQLQRYSPSSASCQCEAGLGRVQGKCSLCPSNQRVDSDGICSPCKQNQVVIQGQCVCMPGYESIENVCIPCSGLVIGGVCSSCAPGYQLVDGTCKITVNSAVQQTRGLENSVVMSKKPVCGNGIIQQLEQCDDYNTKNGDGCSSKCTIQAGYTCSRMPSQCCKIATNANPKTPPTTNANTTTTTTTTTTTSKVNNTTQTNTEKISTSNKTSDTSQSAAANANSNSAGLALQTLSGNSNQIFVTLNTGVSFNFPDQATMQSFLKAKFTGCAPPTFYFSQRAQPNKNLFDCLLIFPSGIPNTKFTAAFSYSYSGSSGELSVPVDPFSISSAMANARSSSPKRGEKVK